MKKDDLTGKKFWVTYDGKGQNEVTFSGGQPLAFPPDNLQIGLKITLIAPGE